MIEDLNKTETPLGDLKGFSKYLKNDLTSGFLVFLIALPLCLGISIACGYPPIAGIFTAIIGSILTTFISNSELTIKGPAAGLIVIALGCINDFGGAGNSAAYKAALAVGVVAAILQILFGLLRAGILSEFFPSSAVHGMLAAIGVIIIIKQFPFALGVIDPETGRTPSSEPLEMVREIPQYLAEANPAIAAIGLVSVLIMFLWPIIGKKLGALKIVPAPMIVLLVSIPMGMAFDLLHQHSYMLQNHEYQLSEQYLVKMPDRVFGMFDDITFPDFSALTQPVAWKWVMMFFIIGSLESILSAKAVDLIDPWKRKTSMNRDILAVGIGNLVASSVGGLPMISEIVRSKANIDNGARTRFADMWHGIFLLACVALIPTMLHRIPLAALAAMLIYTGSRLAHPNEFVNVYRIGKEQLAIFVTTLVMVLVVDLLVGVIAGIALKMVIHVANGVPLKSLFMPYIEVQEEDENTSLIIARESAVFSNWIPFKRQIEEIGLVQRRNLILDVSDVKLIDHSVMEKLEEVERDFEQEGLTFEIRGLDNLQPLADNTHAARKRGLVKMRRITIVADEEKRLWIEQKLLELNAVGVSSMTCSEVGQLSYGNDESVHSQIRIEIVIDENALESLFSFIRKDVMTQARISMCVDSVGVLTSEFYDPQATGTMTFSSLKHV